MIDDLKWAMTRYKIKRVSDLLLNALTYLLIGFCLGLAMGLVR